jgi:hypothetical protein
MIGEGMQGVKGLGRCLACQPLSGVPPKRMRRRNGGFEFEGHQHASKDCARATLFPISRQSVVSPSPSPPRVLVASYDTSTSNSHRGHVCAWSITDSPQDETGGVMRRGNLSTSSNPSAQVIGRRRAEESSTRADLERLSASASYEILGPTGF